MRGNMPRYEAIGASAIGRSIWLRSTRARALLLVTVLVAGTIFIGTAWRGHAAPVAPAVSAVSPNSGPTQGGTGVTIYGTGFTGATAVQFGSSTTNCGGSFGFYTVSDTQIFVFSPSNPVGTVDVVVIGPGGSSAIGPAAKFTYTTPTAPIVNGISPSSGSTDGGTQVTIFGTGFATATGVKFGTNAVQVYPSTDTMLFVGAPAASAGMIDVTVVNAAGSSVAGPADKFTYVAPGGPVVQALSRNHGTAPGGDQVIIIGTGLSMAGTVRFGTAALGANVIGVIDDNHLNVTAPPGTAGTTVDVTVTAPTGTSITSSADRFSYVAATVPIINGVVVNTGPTTGGTSVSLIGSGFTGVTSVMFGTNAATGVSSYADTSLTATSPAASVGSVDITVTTPVGTSAISGADKFTYQTPTTPVIYGISPRTGITTGNTQVAVFGSGLIPGSIVRFGANTGTSVYAYDSGLTVTSPAGPAGTVDVTVTNSAGTSATGMTDKFTYVAPGPPIVRAVTPNRGFAGGGTMVTVLGSGFTGATAVTFGTTATPSTIYVYSDTQLSVSSPAGTSGTTVDVKVTTPVGTSSISNVDQFSYITPVAPTVTAVSPGSGPASGGTSVWITGTALSGVTSVSFGTTPSYLYRLMSDTLIQVFGSPSGTSGNTVDITVVTPGGTSAVTTSDRFAFTAPLAPSITAVGPSTGPASGGTAVYLSGTGFSGATAVNFGTTAVGFQVNNGSVIIATSPAGTSGATVDVRVVGPGGTSAITVNDQFTYTAAVPPQVPTVSAVSPNSGPSAGGTVVYITGTNFTSVTMVRFGGVSASSYTIGASLIQATSPSGTAGTAVDVTVTTAGGTSATSLADKFTYAAAIAPTVTGTSPTTGPAAGATTVYLTGSGFTGLTAVNFGSNLATGIAALSDTLAQATSPAGTGTVHVTVTAPGGTSTTSASDQFVYGGPAPSGLQVNGITTKSGPPAGGTSLNVYGMGFTGATAVKFGTAPAQSFFVASDTNIYATSPAGSVGPVDIRVTVGAGTSATGSADIFTYVGPGQPTVNGLDPNRGSQLGGTRVTIYGSGLTGVTAVRFGATAATILYGYNDTQIAVTAPPGTGTVDVTVTTPIGVSAAGAADNFTFYVPGPPVVYAVDPWRGTSLGGTSVVLYGSALTGATAVSFGSTPVRNFFQTSDTQLYLTSPPGTVGTTVDITVTTPVGTSAISNADKYSFFAPPVPVVNAVSPNLGGTNGRNRVQMYGSGFTGATSVRFGGTVAPGYYSITDDSIAVTSPPGSLGTVDITVTAPGGTSAPSAGDKFTYYAAPAPSITGVSPNTGPAGTLVYISGTGLANVTAVLFGSACAAYYGYSYGASDTMLSVSAPAGPTGLVDIRVVSPEGTSALTVSDQYTYTAAAMPSISAVAPASGRSAGGTWVYITGTGLLGATGVTFGSTPATPFYAIDDNLLQVSSPGGASGTTVDIRVTTPGGTTAVTIADQFAWAPTPLPSVTVVSPSSGPNGGGTEVLITGTGLMNTTQVQFGSTPLARCVFYGKGGPMLSSPAPQPAQSTAVLPFGVRSPVAQPPAQLTTVRVPVATQVPIHQAPTTSGRAPQTAPTYATVMSLSAPVILNTGIQPISPTQPAAPLAPLGGQCFIAYSDNLIDVVSPAQGSNPATVDLRVTSAGGTSATNPTDRFTFTATPAPVITAVRPNVGRSSGGASVFISGSNLANPTSVNFGNAPATIVPGGFYSSRFGSDSLIEVIAPAQGTNPSLVEVTATTAGGTSAINPADQYTYGASPVPTVGVVSPASGPIGATTFITGTGFLGATSVTFGGTPAVRAVKTTQPSVAVAAAAAPTGFVVIGDSLIQVISPTHSPGAVDVRVVTAGGTSAISANDTYTYTASPTPVVTAVGPNTGPAGTVVYITGSGLTGATAVTFGTTAATTFVIFSDTLIRATSPAGSGIVDIRVTTPGGTSATSASDQWTFQGPLPAPTVTSVVPGTGPEGGGTSVTIRGTNFTGATGVKFGAVTAAFTVVDATTITATSPAGTGIVDVSVTTPSGASTVSAADRFTYATPSSGARDANPGPAGVAGSRDASQSPAGTPGPRLPRLGRLAYTGDTPTAVGSAPAAGGAAPAAASTSTSAATASAAVPVDAESSVSQASELALSLIDQREDMMAVSHNPATKVENTPAFPPVALASLAIISLVLLAVRRRMTRRLIGHTRP